MTALTLPDRWTSFTLDDGAGAMIGVETTTNPMGRWGWTAMGRGWCGAGSSNASPQDALEQALAEVEAHETPVVPVTESAAAWGPGS